MALGANSIPASQIVAVNPGVLAAGGVAVALTGLFLTTSTRVPIGTVQSFPNQAAVAAFFGAASPEATAATNYFLGYDNSFAKPAAILFAQYPWTAAVPAYLRSGVVSGLTLSQLQAISGTLTLTVDGVAHTSGAISLAGVSSFSAAATAIQTALASSDVTATGSIAPTSVTASITGTVMTVTAVGSGVLAAGQVVSGGTTAAGTTIVNQLTGTSGGTGTYTVSISQTVVSGTLTTNGGGLTISAVASGTLAVGQTVEGGTTAAGTVITGLGTGVGGTGTYAVNISQTVVSTSLTIGRVLCTYDSQLGCFVISAGMASGSSTITFATGTASAALLFTAATGAVLSQGSAIAVPGTFMAGVVAQTQNWATFTTLFEPATADCVAFSQWNNGQGNRYLYAMWDTDVTVTAPNPTTSAGYLILQANYSGTALIYSTTGDCTKAAFVMGCAASIDFTRLNGRDNLAFDSQSGLVADVTNATIAAQLLANGYNYYGAYATAVQGFNFFYNGAVTGPFLWLDSYLNQIWLNSAFQGALMNLLVSAPAIPYNAQGYGLIDAACMDPINAAVNFGAIRSGVVLSSIQAAEVNNAAGVDISTTLQNRGWYLQIQPASPTTRVARGSPPITFWYMDGQSVQKLTLASIEVQ